MTPLFIKWFLRCWRIVLIASLVCFIIYVIKAKAAADVSNTTDAKQYAIYSTISIVMFFIALIVLVIGWSNQPE
jgi:hypothetical protein